MTAGKRLSGVTAMLAAAVLGVAIGAYGPRSLNAATPAGELPGTPVPAGVVPAPAAGVVVGQATPDLSKASAEMAEAAQNFLAALTPEQLALATFEMKSDERTNWHFIPKVRKGLPLKDMTPAQKALAHALLSSGLSYHGYSLAVTIMSLDQILK